MHAGKISSWKLVSGGSLYDMKFLEVMSLSLVSHHVCAWVPSSNLQVSEVAS